MQYRSRIAVWAVIIGLAIAGTATAREVRVVASTSWVGALAEAAGATRVDVLAPLDLRHPPEYDFKPGDIKRVMDADYVVWAGYEVFMRKIQAAGAVPVDKMVAVFTDNVPATLKEQTQALAKVFGTQTAQAKWEAELDRVTADILTEAKQKGLMGKRAVVHGFLQKYARWMGLEVVGVFGGGEELTAVQMAELIKAKPEIVVDNWHNAQGAGIAAEAKAPRAILINFPGHGGTRTLIDVLRYNAQQLSLPSGSAF
jgi:zinc transport system substrate-binding protein